ncbi:cation diffusion facilitator family transporter [Sphingobium subterraneum]|uniref:Ferrous-iron efflux pump FieF n=1 Tax=Sphingobium subterraneum TaxID=627688 RepID=A0A841IYX2_9SPHN|nr:cation diffusion facilitator family transporter [Sphingobium subterraneum]MBB6123863.1 ferrous-iron efflux pump FieF [Sphingobium subterraneum]
MNADAHALAQGALTRKAALASVAVAVILLGLKIAALWSTRSVAMLGSVADTALDLVASLVTLCGVHVAATPADTQHRFGHGKAEALAALFQVTLITLAAVGLAVESFRRIGNPHPVESATLGIGVSIAAILLSFVLIAYQRRVIAQTGSLAISTDSLHYKSDFFLNLSVIVALVLDHVMGIQGADTLFGFGIALWLGWGAWRSGQSAMEHLMDQEWPIEDRERLIAIASAHPEVRGLHDMRTRTSGSHRFAQFHVWVDPDMTVRRVHDVMDDVEEQLHAAFPGVEILIHPDPDGHVERKDPGALRGRDAFEVLAEEMGEGDDQQA